MTRQFPGTVDPHMPLARLMSQSHAAIGIVYLGAYVLLDWLSYVHPFAAFGITPWNPQTGLSFALILLCGYRFVPWLVLAPLLADYAVRGWPIPMSAEIPIVLINGFDLRRGCDNSAIAEHSIRSDLFIEAIAALPDGRGGRQHRTGGVRAMSSFCSCTTWSTPADFWPATMRAFVGDLIGVMVFTPFLLIVFTRRRYLLPSWEVGLVAALMLVALWGVFGFTGSYRFQLFYVFFIPIVWIAVRFGLEGVTVGLVITQIGLLAAIQISGQSSVDVVSYQALMVVLSITGLAVGVIVNEQRHTQKQLRLHQEALNRASRLGTMGEFAAAVAHEINQPLTAIANYSRLAKNAVEQVPPDAGAAANAASGAIEQVDRAASVIRRLRDLISLGRIEQSRVTVASLVEETIAICRPELEQHNVECDIRIDRDLPPVMADMLQIEQVLLNLFRNSQEALVHAGRHDGRITIEATAGVRRTGSSSG